MDQAEIKTRLARGRAWQRWRFVGLLVILALVANAGVLLPQLDLWSPPRWSLWVLVVLAPLATVAAGFVSPGARQATADVTSSDRVKWIAAAVIQVAETTGIPADRLGISIWSVYRPGRSFWAWLRRKPKRERYLYRVERFRTSQPTPTNVAWPEGRGVIGECIRINRPYAGDFRKLIADCANLSEMSESKWKAITKKYNVLGFGRTEFLDMIRRYEQVLAVPIANDSGTPVGCVSLDVTPVDGENTGPALNVDSQAVRACLHTLQANVAPEIIRAAARP